VGIFLPMEYFRVYISRTPQEWDLIDERIKSLGKSDLNSYLRSRIKTLEQDFNSCPKCICNGVGKKIQRQQYLSPEQFEILNKISDETGIPEGVIVNTLLISPLLMLP